MIDHSMVVQTHCCELPHIVVSGPQPDMDKPNFEPIRIAHPTGTRYFCPGCSKVWTVVWIPDWHGSQAVICAHHAWQRETPRQRRQRLGLHWWQRSDER